MTCPFKFPGPHSFSQIKDNGVFDTVLWGEGNLEHESFHLSTLMA